VKIQHVRITINEGTESTLSVKTEIPGGFDISILPERMRVQLMQHVSYDLAARLKEADDMALLAGKRGGR